MEPWTDKMLQAYRNCLEAEDDLIRAIEWRRKWWAELRDDVRLTQWKQVWHGVTSGNFRFGYTWASHLEESYVSLKPKFDELYDAIGAPASVKDKEPPWRPMVRKELYRRQQERAEFKRILRGLATKDTPAVLKGIEV